MSRVPYGWNAENNKYDLWQKKNFNIENGMVSTIQHWPIQPTTVRQWGARGAPGKEDVAERPCGDGRRARRRQKVFTVMRGDARPDSYRSGAARPAPVFDSTPPETSWGGARLRRVSVVQSFRGVGQWRCSWVARRACLLKKINNTNASTCKSVLFGRV